METTSAKRKSTSQNLKRVAECLYRNVETGFYHAKKKHRGNIKQKQLATEDGLPVSDPALAKRLLRSWIAELDAPQAAKAGSETVAQRLEKHRTRYSGHEEKTRKNVEWFINTLGKTWADFLPLSIKQIKTSDLEAWFAAIRQDYKPSSYNELSRHMAAMFETATADGLLLKNPLLDVNKRTKRRKVQAEPDQIPTEEQFEKIVATIRAQKLTDHAADSGDKCEFLGLAALGEAEANLLAWEHIHLKLGYMQCRRKKTGKFFKVPIFPHLRPLLEKMHDKRGEDSLPTSPVFKVQGVKKGLAAACKSLGYPSFSPRDLRKFGITRMLKAGVLPKTLAKWQSHRDETLIIKRYSDVISDDDEKFDAAQIDKLAGLVK